MLDQDEDADRREVVASTVRVLVARRELAVSCLHSITHYDRGRDRDRELAALELGRERRPPDPGG